jgi:cell division protein FtsZ
MTINLQAAENVILKPIITVVGVGGAGGNAINNMISAKLEGAEFIATNTDAQALEYSLAPKKIQLGKVVTRGLGAGASPEIGAASANEALDEIMHHLGQSNIVFITAGMGGGTGTGAAPVIAKAAKENGILTVGVVTKPFLFEGSNRMRLADKGIEELAKYVDTLIVIPNQNLFRITNEHTTFADAFKMADDVLHAGVRGITDLMIMPGLINLDFADIKTIMSQMGKAMMGTGEAEGTNRAIKAAEAAIANPLLAHSSMKGAKGVLINITGGKDMTLFEVDEAANRIRDEIENEHANIIFGSTFNSALDNKIRVSVVATGIDSTHTKPQVNNTIEAIINEESSLSQEELLELDNELDIAEEEIGLEQAEVSDELNEYINNSNMENEIAENPKKKFFNLSGLFNKFMGPTSQESPIIQAVHKDRTSEASTTEDQGDLYDIPAFIRKQK